MKDYFLDQFKRNRYFYGKLLTVRDFMMEQEYFNGKRYLNNLLVNGSGVVSGLEVSVEGNALHISRGMAIDSKGREIVINQDIELDISKLDGFLSAASSETETYYLCLKYAEDNQEAGFPLVPNSPDIAANPCCKSSCSYCEEFCEHNSIQEGYKFYLRLPAENGSNTAEASHTDSDDLWTSSVKVYEDNQVVRIIRIVPKWINPGEVFPVVLRFEKLSHGSIPDVEITESYSGGIDTVGGINAANKLIRISGVDFGNSDVLEKTYLLRTDRNVLNGSVNVSGLKIGNEIKDISSGKDSFNFFEVVDESVLDKAAQEYIKSMGFGSYVQPEDPICLAEVTVDWDQKGGSNAFIFHITGIRENTKYVYNNDLLFKLISFEEKRLSSTIQNYIENIIKEPGVKSAKSETLIELIDEPKVEVKLHDEELDFRFRFPKESATGTVRFDIGSKLYTGDSDISANIDPRLGSGPICIQLAIENDSTSIYINPAQYELGAVVNPVSGKFKVWYQAKTAVSHADYVKVRWWAFRVSDDSGELSAKSVIIIPKNAEISPGAALQFKALVDGVPSDRIIWSAVECSGKQNIGSLLEKIRGMVSNIRVNEGQNILEMELDKDQNPGMDHVDIAAILTELKSFVNTAALEGGIIRIPSAGSIDHKGCYKAPFKSGNYLIIGASMDNSRDFGTASVRVRSSSSGITSASGSGRTYTSNSIGLNNIYGRVYPYSPGGNPAGH